MMRRNDMVRGSTGGVIVGVIYGLVLLFVSPAWADRPPEGLPDSPEIPDLYDPVIVDTYTVVAKRPYQVNGRELAAWLIATVLTPKAAHVGPPLVSGTSHATGGTPKDVILVIGYVTDTRDGRIIALSETFAHPRDASRSIKAWVDEGWVEKGKGSGEWRPPIRSDTALTPQQTAVFMQQVYRLIQTGFEQTLRR
ncbi:MAG: hypothetical protein ACREJ6_13645 [Candidatus Methylomirabilis sp.]